MAQAEDGSRVAGRQTDRPGGDVRDGGGGSGPWAGARKRRLIELALVYGTGTTAFIPILALAGMVIILLSEAWPAIRFNGFGFLTSSQWEIGSLYGGVVHTGGTAHLAGAHYGAWPLILGTLETAGIALLVGLPIAVLAAILLVERLPGRIGNAVGACLEVLAGVPSAVIGLWGVLSFGPWLAKHIYPALNHLPNVPVLSFFRGDVSAAGLGLLTGSLVLAAMIIPIIAATTRDLLRQVPDTTKEGAIALGMTNAEAFRTVQLRWVRTGIVGAAVLGLGRALGETIAVALLCGGLIAIPHDAYSAMTTIAATIVLQLDAAQSDPTGLAVKSLAEAALVLLVITFATNLIARFIVKRSAAGASLPVGAGF
jgi:phosphate transport system permease protein